MAAVGDNIHNYVGPGSVDRDVEMMTTLNAVENGKNESNVKQSRRAIDVNRFTRGKFTSQVRNERNGAQAAYHSKSPSNKTTT